MKENIIGRDSELCQLEAMMESDRPDLMAVYGRRRIGKTFLIKEFFNNTFDYYATGIYEGSGKEELDAFCDGLYRYAEVEKGNITSWMEAFSALRDFLDTIKKPRIVVFLDELPWLDVPPSRFLKAFEWFWNSWGSTKPGLKVIVCGSATTWMVDRFINGKGGLYNRVTERIYLPPFSLRETESLLQHNGIDWSRAMILEAYMIFGGVPFYLSMLKRSLGLDANVDELFFREKAPLKDEYSFIFRSLFKNSEYYTRLLDTIGSKNMGMTRKEIREKGNLPENGVLTKALKNLEMCDFIRKYSAYGKKERDAIFQLTDLSVLFFKRFVENYNGRDLKHWTNMVDNPTRTSWTGIAFEQVSLLHLEQIKRALGISGVSTEACSWQYRGDEYTPGAQIDLLIARRDRVINICEMKYARDDFEVSSLLEKEMRRKKSTFTSVTGTRCSLHLTLVTPWGLKRNANSGIFNQCITMDDLFCF